MSSCDLAADCILSAIQLSKYDKAKRLCEIFYFENKSKFAFIYGITNFLLDNEPISKLVVSSDMFAEGFTKELGLMSEDCWAKALLKMDVSSQNSYEGFVNSFKAEICNRKSDINRKLFGKI